MKLADLDPDSRLTIAEAAAATGMSRQNFRYHVRIREIPTEKIADQPITIRVGDLQDFLTIRAIEAALRNAFKSRY